MSPEAAAVGVIDYQLNNLTSMCRALAEAGAARVEVLERPERLESFSHLVLPGVGSFDVAMGNLESVGWPEALRAAADQDVPLLGVCLGMQLLVDGSAEGAPVPGLGLVPGRVERLPSGAGARIPHVGWNTASPRTGAELFAGLEDDYDFYFVHSFAVRTVDEAATTARTPFGSGDFASALGRGSVSGVQFHPEKSSRAGLRLLRNFLDRG